MFFERIVDGARRSPHGERGLKSIKRHDAPDTPGWSLSSWRAWIEIRIGYAIVIYWVSRSPHGERGLKFNTRFRKYLKKPSLSSWRAWIEMSRACSHTGVADCRSPHGERGLKFGGDGRLSVLACRSPHGERGLKFTFELLRQLAYLVALLMESVD